MLWKIVGFCAKWVDFGDWRNSEATKETASTHKKLASQTSKNNWCKFRLLGALLKDLTFLVSYLKQEAVDLRNDDQYTTYLLQDHHFIGLILFLEVRFLSDWYVQGFL